MCLSATPRAWCATPTTVSISSQGERGLKGLGGSFADKLSRGQSPPGLSHPCPGFVQLLTALALLPRVRPPLHTCSPPRTRLRCPIPVPSLFRHSSLQLPDENALSETAWPETFPGAAGQEVSQGLASLPASEDPERFVASRGSCSCSALSSPSSSPSSRCWRGGHGGGTTPPTCASYDARRLAETSCARRAVGTAPPGLGGAGGSSTPPRKAPAPLRRSVYIVFLCIWVKDVQYKSSVCSRYDFIFITCIPCSSHPLHASPGCLGTASLGFGPLPR